MARKVRRALGRVAFYLFLALIIFYTVFPFYWAIVSSLKSGSELFTVDFWPPHPAWDNYVAVFREQPFGRNILNSVFVAVSTVILSLALAVAAAYALGRIRFRGRTTLLIVVLGVSMFPQIAVLSGMFELIRSLGLYNNLLALTLSYMIFTLPFTVWVLTTFMRELPKELEVAAIVDGAKPLTIVTKVFMPLMGPALATTGLLAFIAAWNEFLFALTFTLSSEMRTVPV
ncbi:MAG TPA: carbohydrate ABC transporter permease, partial [Geminicoccaceae bacterium]|nr:carbohydrate ABC transporter permease [Geminicoccaceae bacterium]